MISQDYPAMITELVNRVVELEKQNSELKKVLNQIKNPLLLENQDWDRKTLQRQWQISERSTFNFQKQGLQSFKRGGRVYFSPESRDSFKKQINNNN